MREWRWRAGLVGWAFHDGIGTLWIQYAWRAAYPDGPSGPVFRVALPGAADADAFDVTILVSGRPLERYRLRGGLAHLQQHLPAVLARKLAQPSPPTPTPPAKWNGAGCWCPMHAAEV